MSERLEEHATEEQLALYVLGALDPERAVMVESHVSSCDECAAGLAREARLEAALELVARTADGEPEQSAARSTPDESRALAAVVSLLHVPAHTHAAQSRVNQEAARRSRWAGGVAGALAAAAALVLAFASATAPPRSDSAGVAQRAPGMHDAAGDMSGAFGAEVVMADGLDGG